MRKLKVTKNTPDVLTEDVYLHLRPKALYAWGNDVGGLTVVKIAKSTDALVEPGDFIVKVAVSVPGSFFADAMPSARIELEPGMVVPVMVEQIEEQD